MWYGFGLLTVLELMLNANLECVVDTGSNSSKVRSIVRLAGKAVSQAPSMGQDSNGRVHCN